MLIHPSCMKVDCMKWLLNSIHHLTIEVVLFCIFATTQTSCHCSEHEKKKLDMKLLPADAAVAVVFISFDNRLFQGWTITFTPLWDANYCMYFDLFFKQLCFNTSCVVSGFHDHLCRGWAVLSREWVRGRAVGPAGWCFWVACVLPDQPWLALLGRPAQALLLRLLLGLAKVIVDRLL